MATDSNALSESALQDLAERIEAADGPDRETDIHIALAIDWSHPSAGCTLRQFHALGESVADLARDAERQTSILMQLPRYTASLDAAMTLVPEGWAFSLGEMMGLPEQYRWRCHLRDHNEPYDPATCKWVDRDCYTPALAICAASLRARHPKG